MNGPNIQYSKLKKFNQVNVKTTTEWANPFIYKIRFQLTIIIRIRPSWRQNFKIGIITFLLFISAMYSRAFFRFRTPFRMLIAALNFYSSMLTSHLTSRNGTIPPKDPFELMDQGKHFFLLVSSGIGIESVLVYKALLTKIL